MKKKILVSLFCSIGALAFLSCNKSNEALPVYGQFAIENGDTIYHSIPDFEFMNQDSIVVTNDTYKDYVYVTDFFFTSCPSICPKVKKQMLRIYEKYKNEDRVKLVSHTIDPKRDSVHVLRQYAGNLGVSTDKWHFLTGEKDKLLGIADDYFVVAYEDPSVPGGFDHSGKILLVDTKRHVRAFCDGTDPETVTKFMKDIDKLLDEYSRP